MDKQAQKADLQKVIASLKESGIVGMEAAKAATRYAARNCYAVRVKYDYVDGFKFFAVKGV